MKNKRIFQIVAIIALFIPTYLAIYNVSIITSDKISVENTNKVIVETSDGNISEYVKRDDIDFYIKIINNAKGIKDTMRDLTQEQPILIKFYKAGKEIPYRVYLSLSHTDCIFLNEENELYLIDSKEATKILKTDLIDYLYPYKTIPSVRLVQPDSTTEVFPYKPLSEWYLKKSDDKYYVSSVKSKTVEINEVNIAMGKPIMFEFDIEPSMRIIVIQDEDDNIIYDGLYEDLSSFVYEKDALLKYTLTVEWLENEFNNYYGKAVYNLNVNYDVPVQYDLSDVEASVGEIIVLVAQNTTENEEILLQADNGYETKFVKYDGKAIALLPIDTNTNNKAIGVNLYSSNTVTPTAFSFGIKELNQVKKNIGARDDIFAKHKKLEPQTEKNDGIKAIIEDESNIEGSKLWNGTFDMPYEGTILLNYGWSVTTNMSAEYKNDGIEISTVDGNSVKASNSGKVIHVGELPDIGQFIVIEHGFGIKSWYGHLGTINVSVGDSVTKGQEIALSGTSGIYTNLKATVYFAISIKNAFVNPNPIIAKGIPGFDYSINTTNITNNSDSTDDISTSDAPQISDDDLDAPPDIPQISD